MRDIIQRQKDKITRELKGYDSSLRLKGNSLVSILNKIDSDTSITDEKIGKLYNIWYNSIVFATNSGRIKRAQAEWIMNNITNIRVLLKTYARLNSSVYHVDESLINWFEKEVPQNGVDDFKDINENDLGFFIFEYRSRIYTVEIYPEGGDMIESRCIMIGLTNDGNEANSCCFSYGCSTSKEYGLLKECLLVECNNTKCPRYKQALGKVYNHDFKDVSCSVEDCDKCGMFSRSNQLSPNDALTVAKAIYKCILHRDNSTNSYGSFERKEYEHIPRPQRSDDVVIYFGGNKEERDKKLFEKLSMNSNQGGIVDSHASPREHIRHNGSRRETMRYNPKTGKKDIKVRGCEKVSDCVVNKGNTKTTYKLKERKK